MGGRLILLVTLSLITVPVSASASWDLLIDAVNIITFPSVISEDAERAERVKKVAREMRTTYPMGDKVYIIHHAEDLQGDAAYDQQRANKLILQEIHSQLQYIYSKYQANYVPRPLIETVKINSTALIYNFNATLNDEPVVLSLPFKSSDKSAFVLIDKIIKWTPEEYKANSSKAKLAKAFVLYANLDLGSIDEPASIAQDNISNTANMPAPVIVKTEQEKPKNVLLAEEPIKSSPEKPIKEPTTIEASKNGQGNIAGTAANDQANSANLLRELKKLHQEGIITDADFEKKKKEVLDKMQ